MRSVLTILKNKLILWLGVIARKFRRPSGHGSQPEIFFVSQFLITFVIIILLIAISGCAKTVTTIGAVGSQITFDVSFREAMNPQYRYFIMLGKTNAPHIPFSPNEMVQPWEGVTDTQVNYFTDFYSTWGNYLLIQGQNAALVPGPFVTSTTVEAQSLFDFTRPSPNRFVVSLALNRMSFGNATPQNLFVDIIAVNGQNKVVDNLSNNALLGTDSTLVVPTDQGTRKTGQDETQSSVDGALDITDYVITIQ